MDKLYIEKCPYCGRCVCNVTTSDNTSIVRVIKDIPELKENKTFYHRSTCPRCRKPVVVTMKFAS